MIANDPNLEIYLARDEQDLLGAQRLRYRVFVKELGGDGPLVDHHNQLEKDQFDQHFDHLILVDRRRDAAQLNHVVGVYRMLRGVTADRAGGFYSEVEYDLSALRNSGRKLLELGRSCLDKEYRGGMALHLLWSGLADYVARHEVEILFGVASFHGTNLSTLREPLSYLHHRHLAPEDLRVRLWSGQGLPANIMDRETIDRLSATRALPALIKAYLRLGGFVGQGAYVDQAFNTTDVCLILDIARMNPHQKRLYTGETTK
ncbi:MAG: ornithine-acyl-ACP acyltransferase [Marinosulfonomonas sp.]|nr:MAG: ornithine-acyl-ACP acyltransferase [Marinosulfonomonas sp.]